MENKNVRISVRRFGASALLGGVCLAVMASVLTLSASIGGAIDPVTDYTTYPPALPSGCAGDGTNILNGVGFSSGGQSAASLRDLPVASGAVVTMTWASFAPGCEGVGIGLSIKTSPDTVFIPSDNQYVVTWDYCGPDGPACAAPFALTLQLPPASEVPCWQLDAHIGAPLAVVGPAGTFYSYNQPRNYLISARNDGVPPCGLVACVSNPSIPAPAWLCAPTTTTTTTPTTTTTTEVPPPPKETTTTSPPVITTAPCVDNPAVGATDPACKPQPKTPVCTGTQVLDVVTNACVVKSSGIIPVTGAAVEPMFLFSLILLTLGGMGLVLGNQTRRRA